MKDETPRAVFDTMVLFQWAALAVPRLHGTDLAVAEGRIIQCLSGDLIDEIGSLLSRPSLQSKSPSLTPTRISRFLIELRRRCLWFDHVPRAFTFQLHTKDDHLFNLAIVAKADFLVTWERRLLDLEGKHPDVAAELGRLAPRLRIVDPPSLMASLRVDPPSGGT